jgi:hypothetical protein
LVGTTPGVFDWYLLTSGIYIMVCDTNP